MTIKTDTNPQTQPTDSITALVDAYTPTPKEKKKLSDKTNDFLVRGASPADLAKSLYHAVKDMKAKNYSLYDVYETLSEKNVPGLGKLTVDSMKEVQNAYYGKQAIIISNGTQQSEALQTFQDLLNIFKNKLLIYQNETYFWKESDSNIVKKISFAELKPIFFQELTNLGLVLLNRQLVEMMNSFFNFANPHLTISKIPAAFSTSKDELTFRYLDINERLRDAPCPTWDAFIQYCGPNGRALMAYTWSIFYPVELRQYLLLRSRGKTGKGSYTEWVQNILGADSTCSLFPKNPHWPSLCVGKRLGLFPELSQTAFVQSSEFKAITGQDYVNITEKFEKSYSTKLDIRFILSTNGSIDIESRTSESSRCILVDMQPVTEYIPDYKAKLAEETPGFLYKCKQAFEELYDSKLSEIKVDKSDFEAHSITFEDDYELLFERAFRIDENAKIRSVTFTNAINVTNSKYDKYFKQNFKEWVLRTKPVKIVKLNGNYYFKNLTLNAELMNSPLIVKLHGEK